MFVFLLNVAHEAHEPGRSDFDVWKFFCCAPGLQRLGNRVRPLHALVGMRQTSTPVPPNWQAQPSEIRERTRHCFWAGPPGLVSALLLLLLLKQLNAIGIKHAARQVANDVLHTCEKSCLSSNINT